MHPSCSPSFCERQQPPLPCALATAPPSLSTFFRAATPIHPLASASTACPQEHRRVSVHRPSMEPAPPLSPSPPPAPPRQPSIPSASSAPTAPRLLPATYPDCQLLHLRLRCHRLPITSHQGGGRPRRLCRRLLDLYRLPWQR